MPFAFSADGGSLYGATVHDMGPNYRPAIRVALDSLGAGAAAVTPIDRFPVGGPEGFVPTGYPSEAVDPLTGRTIEIEYAGSAPRLVIHEPDGETSIEVDDLTGDIWATTWAGDGRLLATVMHGLAGSDEHWSLEARWIEADGTLGPVALWAERVNGGGPWLSRPGWMLFEFHADEAILVVLLRTSDGATATVQLDQDDLGDVVAIDLVDAGPGR